MSFETGKFTVCALVLRVVRVESLRWHWGAASSGFWGQGRVTSFERGVDQNRSNSVRAVALGNWGNQIEQEHGV
jgi:hypothetical protein